MSLEKPCHGKTVNSGSVTEKGKEVIEGNGAGKNGVDEKGAGETGVGNMGKGTEGEFVRIPSEAAVIEKSPPLYPGVRSSAWKVEGNSMVKSGYR
ncbi:hypothetical protein CMUS01_03838 [Colletotrichum musicola]|uniref:Uncharacterized protein n=1 Tax=Colletotrichum musicola TaxID=2175873 RepID=A0A8H6U5C5_9PEZI|nr:hypothetical protein CMUS01_03838 [Colletotrichum musicola]